MMQLLARLFFTLGFFFICTSVYSSSKPHFYIQMLNNSKQDTTLSFTPIHGNIQLTPILPNDTLLSSGQTSQIYGVTFEPLGKDDVFSINFKGKAYCNFEVSFYGPGNPKIVIVGPGCRGGGYQVINGTTLLLFVSDIYVI